jgi:hypothetical protein
MRGINACHHFAVISKLHRQISENKLLVGHKPFLIMFFFLEKKERKIQDFKSLTSKPTQLKMLAAIQASRK